MRKLIYICGTTVFAAIVIFAWSQSARDTSSAPVPVISQGLLSGADVPTERPLPVEAWDAF